ncbi:DUF3600 domain-containing protein [Fontibacillus panacisegetis]
MFGASLLNANSGLSRDILTSEEYEQYIDVLMTYEQILV